MEIRQINSNSSFGMAWNKAAKPYLIEAITTLSHSKQTRAVEIINRLEQNSPNHEISVYPTSGFFSTKALRPEVGEIIVDFISGKRNIGFFSALKKLDRFVASENAALPQRQPVFSQLSNSLAYMVKRDVFESGVRMFDDSMPKVISALTKDMVKKGRSVESVVEQLKRIDEAAKANELKIYIKKDEVDVSTKTLENVFGFKNIPVKLEHLDFIEDSIGVYANMKKARTFLVNSVDEAKTKAGEKTLIAQLGLLRLVKKFQSTKAYKFFDSMRQKHANKLKEAALQREKERQEAIKKITEEIKI